MADAWMPMYWADYFADTRHLDTFQHGAYCLLIGTYWRRGKPLPDDDAFLAKVTNMSGQKWKRVRPIVAQFFAITDGEWHHKRIDIELLRSSRRQAAAVANGRAGGLAKSYLSTTTSTEEKKDIGQIGRTGEAKAANEIETEFEESFWPEYPRKVAKGAARRAFKAARAKADLPSILAALKRQKPQWTDPKFIPHPATWLNGERWLDGDAGAKADQSPAEVYDIRKRAFLASGGKTWLDHWGPRPIAGPETGSGEAGGLFRHHG